MQSLLGRLGTGGLLRTVVRFKKYEHKDALVRFRTIKPVYPPPGLALELPDWPVEKFLASIGFGAKEHAEKFTNLEEVINASSEQMWKKEIPCDLRKYIIMIRERLRRGVLTFEYLERRNTDLTKNIKVSMNKTYKQLKKGKLIGGVAMEKKGTAAKKGGK